MHTRVSAWAPLTSEAMSFWGGGAVPCTAGRVTEPSTSIHYKRQEQSPSSTSIHYKRQEQYPSSNCDNQKCLQMIDKCPLTGKVTTHSSLVTTDTCFLF